MSIQRVARERRARLERVDDREEQRIKRDDRDYDEDGGHEPGDDALRRVEATESPFLSRQSVGRT